MKGVLEFNLDDPEDKEEFEVAQKGRWFQMAVHKFDNDILRKAVKYEQFQDRTITDSERELVDHLRSELWRILTEYDLNNLF